MTVNQCAEELNITKHAVLYRIKVLKIGEVKGKRAITLTEKDKHHISEFKGYYPRKRIDTKVTFDIIEKFLLLNNNSESNISKLTGVPKFTVSYVITQYLKNDRSIIIESKINNL